MLAQPLAVIAGHGDQGVGLAGVRQGDDDDFGSAGGAGVAMLAALDSPMLKRLYDAPEEDGEELGRLTDLLTQL